MLNREEKEDERVKDIKGVWNIHKDAIFAFVWLFFGFVVAFSVGGIFFQEENIFNPQVEAYCEITKPMSFELCVDEYSGDSKFTGSFSREAKMVSILQNNLNVMAVSFFFSLIFGAGAIFILAWNASVIAAAVGIFSEYKLINMPLGLLRYMIHGFPEMTSYFTIALAGGIVGVNLTRNKLESKKSLRVIGNSLLLIFISFVILFAAAFIEVYVTPLIFG
jgi:uncharacterized membrane protein SpoIIM required for sporulation